MGFDGLSYVSRSLQAYSAALDVTGQNLSQMNAPGYTRQRVTPDPGPAPITGMPDQQVSYRNDYRFNDVDRLRNSFLDRAIRTQVTSSAAASANNALMQQISTVFDESRTDGIIASANKFTSALSQAGLQPSNIQFRQNVLAQADSLAATFEGKAVELQSALDQSQSQLDESLTRVNSILQELAGMNQAMPQIATSDVNALQDRRDVLLDELSQYMVVQDVPQPQGDLVIYAGGVPLVYGKTARSLQQDTDAQGNAIITTDSGRALTLGDGKLGALLTLQNQTIPGYIDRLNNLAISLSDRINQGLANSFDLSGVSGAALFSVSAGASGTASDPNVKFVSATSATRPGTYDVRVTQAAAQGQVQGRTLTVAQVAGVGGTVGQTADTGSTIRIQAGAADVTLAIGGSTLSDVINAISTNPTLKDVVSATANGGNLVLSTQRLSTNTADLTVTFNSPSNAFGLDASAPGGVQSTAQATAGARAQLASNETLTFTDGAGTSTQITLTAGTLVSTAMTQVNTVLQAQDIGVTASFASGAFRLTNNEYGSATYVKNTVASSQSLVANGLGLMVTAGNVGRIGDPADAAEFNAQTAGQDVMGNISGSAATGIGQVLTSTAGPSTGLAVRYSGTTTPVGSDAGQIIVTNSGAQLSMRRILNDPSKLALASGSMKSAAAIASTATPVSADRTISSESTKFSIPLSTASGTFKVNGQEVNWDSSQSLNEVLSQIPGVKATFDSANQKVVLTRDPSTGTTGPDIVVQDVTGNLGAALGLIGATMESGAPGDGSSAQSLVDIINAGGPSSISNEGINGLRRLSSDIALQASLSQNAESTSTTIQKALESQRQQATGVNADEEAVNLIQYQRAYEGAVQLAKAQDSLLQSLISMVAR